MQTASPSCSGALDFSTGVGRWWREGSVRSTAIRDGAQAVAVHLMESQQQIA